MSTLHALLGFLLLASFSRLILSKVSDPDAGNIPEIIESRGFKCEAHYITTKDGYILATHRIVNPLARKYTNETLKPVVMQSGFLGTGADFLINSADGFVDEYLLAHQNDLNRVDFGVKGRNLGFLLANLGYDVWIMNPRGNYYSRNHTSLNPDDDKDKRFWATSLDDIALIDLPTVIDYVLDVTREKSVGYVGFSRGSTVMFALLADNPRYAEKVKPFIALAPAVFMQNFKSAARFLVRSSYVLNEILNNPMECFPRATLLVSGICARFWPVCDFIELFQLQSWTRNESRVDIYMSHVPAGAPCWDIAHFGQSMVQPEFKKLDLGKDRNVKKYGTPEPPRYPLEDIISEDIAIIKAMADTTANSTDIESLKKTLKDLLSDRTRLITGSNNWLELQS